MTTSTTSTTSTARGRQLAGRATGIVRLRRRWLTARGMLAVAIGVLALGVLVIPIRHFHSPSTAIAICGVAFALLCVWRPAGPWASCVIVTSAVEWMMSTGLDGIPAAGVVAVYPLVLYLLHSTAAFAATLPPQADVAGAVVLGWLWRTGRVLLVSLPLVVVGALLPTLRAGVGYSIFALALALLAVALLVHTLRRQDT
ncbi:MAG: hypothetical protein ACJ73S_11385 [Mycobacteriales bacterium]